MTQQEKNAKMDAIVAKMLMLEEGIPESIAEKAISIYTVQANSGGDVINSKPQDGNAMMAAIVARMANPPESVPARIFSIARGLQNSQVGYYADREPDASWYRPSYHKRGIETLNKEQIERDKELQQRNEARRRHRDRMEKLCRGALFLFDEEFKKETCKEDEWEYIPTLPPEIPLR